MGGREETEDESGTLHLLGGNNLGSFLISLNRGTAAKCTLNIFSLLPAVPERQKTMVADKKGHRCGNHCAHCCSGLKSACPSRLIFGSSQMAMLASDYVYDTPLI